MIGLNKTECIRTAVPHGGPDWAISDVEYPAAGWVDWCDHRRVHSSLGYVSPDEHEAAHRAILNRDPQPVRQRQRAWFGPPEAGAACAPAVLL